MESDTKVRTQDRETVMTEGELATEGRRTSGRLGRTRIRPEAWIYMNAIGICIIRRVWICVDCIRANGALAPAQMIRQNGILLLAYSPSSYGNGFKCSSGLSTNRVQFPSVIVEKTAAKKMQPDPERSGCAVQTNKVPGQLGINQPVERCACGWRSINLLITCLGNPSCDGSPDRRTEARSGLESERYLRPCQRRNAARNTYR